MAGARDPRDYRTLARSGWLSAAQAQRLHRIATRSRSA
jgi:hypothetical protein